MSSFTGRRRQRKTSRRVLFADLFARALITAGGIGTIIAVSTVCVFLVAVVAPLFGSASSKPPRSVAAGVEPIHLEVDEYRVLCRTIDRRGVLRVFRADTAEVIEERPLFGDERLTSWSFDRPTGTAAFGFASGRFVFTTLRWKTAFFDPDKVPEALRTLKTGELAPYSWTEEVIDDAGDRVDVTYKGIAQRTPIGQLRCQALVVTLGRFERVGRKPVALIGHAATKENKPPPVVVCWLKDAPPEKSLRLVRGRMQKNMSDGTVTLRFKKKTWLPYEPLDPVAPARLLVSSLATHTLLVWPDGRALRFRRYKTARPIELAEKLDLVPGDATLTAASFILGGETLVVGDSSGRLSSWFAAPDDGRAAGQTWRFVRDAKTNEDQLWVFAPGSHALERFSREGTLEGAVRREKAYRGEMDVWAPSDAIADAYVAASTRDGSRWARCSVLRMTGPAIHSLAAATRTRMVAAGFVDGAVSLYHVTAAREVLRLPAAEATPVEALAVTPKENGLAAIGDGTLRTWEVDPAYPEVTTRTLFRKVWYEGYPGPVHMWQSSSGDDASEPKLGLVPLIFGTIKATIYSMIFGAPLALLAAIYSSQFLSPERKATIKPLIEMMASLPSVVLGFLAALIFAPFVERWLPGVLGMFVCVPLSCVFGAYLWQLLPAQTTLQHHHLRLPLLIFAALPLGALTGFFAVGPLAEALLFDGDAMAYLDGANQVPRRGGALGGWAVLLFPLCALFVAFASGRVGARWLGGNARHWTRSEAARYTLAKFVVGIVATVALTLLLSAILAALADARGGDISPLDTYVQRNALVVGFVMGFAIIPIIFTIADDALSMVPDHLRFASLGAGATPWQTAMRIVVPTAMSGLFSACMIGLGRAVGETMIVLMATGNTPIMEMNLFNGFRTLSANIATELPEAVEGSAHYRTLFLAALILFAMTFVLNTLAEAVRLRFRKKAVEL